MTQFKHDRVVYADCFYRNIHLYRYVAILDIDEVIVPLKAGQDWAEMVKYLQSPRNKGFSNFTSRVTNFAFHNHYLVRNNVGDGDNVTNVDHNIPDYMFMLNRRSRTQQV